MRRELVAEIGAVATDELVDPGEVSTANGILGEVMRLFLAVSAVSEPWIGMIRSAACHSHDRGDRTHDR
jgi:hypothetical protein